MGGRGACTGGGHASGRCWAGDGSPATPCGGSAPAGVRPSCPHAAPAAPRPHLRPPASDYGIAFHVNSSDGLVEEWSRAVLALKEGGTLQALRDSWIVSSTAGCQQRSQVNSGAQPVHFADM